MLNYVTYTENKDAANLEDMNAGDLEKSFNFYLCARVAWLYHIFKSASEDSKPALILL